MNMNNSFCTLIGHELLLITHLCVFEDCKLLQKACCIQCMNEGIHNHEKFDNDHLIQEQSIQNNYYKLPQLKNDKNKDNKLIDFSKRKYDIKQIDQTFLIFNTAQISKDEKYLAYGGEDSILKIYDIQKDEIIKEIQFDGTIYVCQFSFDSSMLYVACNYEISVVICYDLNKNFKKIFQLFTYSEPFYDITIQNQYFMTFGQDQNIIKTDFKRRKQLFKFNGSNSEICTMDYNQSNDFIISGNQDRSINLWYCGKRKLILKKYDAHSNIIQKIQFINNISNVLSLDDSGSLYNWSLDLINNQLIKLQEYEDHRIQGFSQINQNQNLILICENYIAIIDEQGEIINQIEHQCENINILGVHRQLGNARYIPILSYGIQLLQKDKIVLLSAQQ